jgi:hypothetical protein
MFKIYLRVFKILFKGVQHIYNTHTRKFQNHKVSIYKLKQKTLSFLCHVACMATSSDRHVVLILIYSDPCGQNCQMEKNNLCISFLLTVFAMYAV